MGKVTRVEELNEGNSRRISTYTIDESGNIIPPKMSERESKEWNRIMRFLEKLKLSHIVDGVRLADHCRDSSEQDTPRSRLQS